MERMLNICGVDTDGWLFLQQAEQRKGSICDVKEFGCHVLQALCLVSHRAALCCYMVSMKIEMTSLFCNNRKAQVVCYIDFIKVKAGVSKNVTVISRKGQTQDLCNLLV